jgi:hypothetical protein
MGADLHEKSVGGMLAYCEYLAAKGYASKAQIDPWRTAIQKVFSTVEGDGFESLDLTGVDLAEYLDRFQKLAGADYKAESITTYHRRIERAINAHDHYLATGKPPSFRQRSAKGESKGQAPAPKSEGSVVGLDAKAPALEAPKAPAAGLMEFPFPLKGGKIAKLHLPTRLAADDVNRLSAFLRALQDEQEEQRQLMRRTGQEAKAA